MRNACLAFALFLVTGCDGARPFPDYGPSPDDLAVRDLAARDLQSPCGPCENPTPKCEIVSKKCVACLADADCPDAFVCAKGACMPGCSKSHLQCGDAGSCDLDAGICHGCLSDKDCADPKSPACDVPSGRCGACSTQNDRCPAGSYCVLSGGAPACVPGCKTDVECQFRDGGVGSSACCDHACVNTATSLTHCGACGAACNKTDCCAGRCVDAQSDLMNCGGCGKACPAKNNVPTCAGGTCGTGGCVMGFADCDGSAANGCETATSSDKNNCGACGKVCNIPNASALCSVGSCVVQSCNAGFRDCNGDPADGCEINLQMDPMNCGVCGQSCAALPHASAGCKNGACNIGACDAGWGDCDGMAGNGLQELPLGPLTIVGVDAAAPERLGPVGAEHAHLALGPHRAGGKERRRGAGTVEFGHHTPLCRRTSSSNTRGSSRQEAVGPICAFMSRCVMVRFGRRHRADGRCGAGRAGRPRAGSARGR